MHVQTCLILIGLIVPAAIFLNTVFGQSNQTAEKSSTLECIPYKQTNLVVVKIFYAPAEVSKAQPTNVCLDELNKQILSFRPTAISISTLESVASSAKGAGSYREDLIYLIK